MQREILRIAGHTVDIIPNTINRNLSINDLGSAEDRSSNYSNTVRLPLTSTNKQIFDFLGVAGNTSRAPYKQLPCSYSVDGIPLINNGYAEIKATGANYEVVLYDGVIDLSEKIKGKTLSDLNYSDLNHYLSVANYTNSFSATSGYIYALGDFGIPGVTQRVERTVPSIYTHTLWDKIFKEVGINYEGSFFTQNNDFLTEVVTPPLGYEVQDIQPTYTAFGSYNTNMVEHLETSQVVIFEADERFGFSTTFSDSRVSFGINGEITFNTSTRYRLNINVSYNSTEGHNSYQVYHNGRPIRTEVLSNIATSVTIKLNMSVTAGDKLYFVLKGSDYENEPEQNPNTGLDDGNGNTVNNQYRVDYTASATIGFEEVTGGLLVDFKQMMGTMTQLAFVKDILYRYGLILKPIRGTDNYEFIQFEDLLNDRDGVEDWSQKLVGVDKESYATQYAKENTAKYNYHEDIEVPTHNGILTIDNENADAEKTFFSSPYEIPTTLKTYSGLPLYYHPTWEQKDEDGVSVIKVKETKIKTFRITRKSMTHSASYFNDSSAVTFTGGVPFLTLNNMSLQYFLNVYYKAYQLTIENYKEVDMTLHLSDLDIYKLDFFKLKYFRQNGKYYYCNKIQHKAGGKVSTGVFIELAGFALNRPVETLGTSTYNLNYGDTRTVPVSALTTNSTPGYYDPENDPAFKIKFLTGNNTQVKLYQAGVEITTGQEILVSNWNVTVKDMSTTNAAHQKSWDYQIMDAGSGSYGSAIGTFTASVYEFTNTNPVANAGADKTVTIPNDTYTSLVVLSGSNSYDPNGDTISYQWSIFSKPANSSANLSSRNSVNAALSVPNTSNSVGSYSLVLTVTDQHGAVASDNVVITIQQSTSGGGTGPGGGEVIN